jgi:TetR/AcrR family transcriptional repressor of bet genes
VPRPSNTDERRAQIVAGLMQVMATQGYDGASTQTIAEAAGLSPGLVHYHFDSKREVLLALIETLGARVRARFERRAESAASPRARLYAFIDAHLALGTDASPDGVACWVGIGAEALREKTVQAAYRRAVRASLDQLELLVEAVLVDEQRASAGVPEIAAGLMSAIYGAYQLASAAQAAPKGFAAGAVRRMADGLISAQRPRS